MSPLQIDRSKTSRSRHSSLRDELANRSLEVKRFSGRLFGSLLLACLFLGSGCQTAPPTSRIVDRGGSTRTVSLAAGDVVKLTFPGSPELNGSQKIQTDGKINLPMIGQVQASGRSIASLQSELSARYKSQLQNTEVVVNLESSVTPVVISGAVEKPGKLLFDRPTTIFQAIMEAGGMNKFGNLRNVHLIRTAGGRQVTTTLDLRATLEGKTTDAIYVRNGDIIYVPESLF